MNTVSLNSSFRYNLYDVHVLTRRQTGGCRPLLLAAGLVGAGLSYWPPSWWVQASPTGRRSGGCRPLLLATELVGAGLSYWPPGWWVQASPNFFHEFFPVPSSPHRNITN